MTCQTDDWEERYNIVPGTGSASGCANDIRRETVATVRGHLEPFRTTVPFWGQTTWSLTDLSPKPGLRF